MITQNDLDMKIVGGSPKSVNFTIENRNHTRTEFIELLFDYPKNISKY